MPHASGLALHVPGCASVHRNVPDTCRCMPAQIDCCAPTPESLRLWFEHCIGIQTAASHVRGSPINGPLQQLRSKLSDLKVPTLACCKLALKRNLLTVTELEITESEG